MLTLIKEEKARLQRLNTDRATIEALKKLFLNAFTNKSHGADVNVLAAERLAIELLGEAFKELSRIQSDTDEKEIGTNII